MNDIVERLKEAEIATHALFNHIFQDAREEIERLRAQIEAIHSLLDGDESKIIRNAKDGYPEGREPKELTLTERVTALCKYASDWKRWFSEAESKIERMERQAHEIERLRYLVSKTYYIHPETGNLHQVLMDNLLADVAKDVLESMK